MAAAGGLVVSSNTIKGNMHEQQKTFLTNVISDNITDGNLRCQQNDVPPEVNGRPNGVKGEAGGQCAELAFEDWFITHKLLLEIDGADGLHMTVNAVGEFKVEDGNVNVNVNVDVATSH